MEKGVMLLNMGGPNSIDEVELFLKNMFADKHILPLGKNRRKLVGSIIIKKRLKEAEDNYRQLGGRSPLTEITQSLCKKVEGLSGLPVLPAMRYVPPFASDAIKEFQQKGIEKIVLFPMYPQYSTTTTLSSVEDVVEQCRAIGYDPVIKTVEPYAISDGYLKLQINGIRQALGDKTSEDYDLLLSAHGLPMSIVKAGDPYPIQVEANVYKIKEKLRQMDMRFRSVKLVYQSKVGGGEWLEPNLIDALRRPDHLKVLIYPLAFTIDNSETVFELDIEHREIAEKIGYEDYLVAKCPNDSDEFAEFIVEQISTV